MAGKSRAQYLIRRLAIGVGSLSVGLTIPGNATNAFAQNPQVATQSSAPPRVGKRRVTVHADNALLRTVLQHVADQAELTLVYPGDVVPATARVTIQIYQLPVDAAFSAVLRGTGARAVLTSGNRAVIVAEPQGVSKGTSVTQGGFGGRILHGVTRDAVSGAMIMIYGPTPDSSSAVTVQSNQKGYYSVEGLTAGTYRLVVRKVGMSVATRMVTITDGPPTVINIELHPSATQLQALVTTGAGERERVKVGNWVTTINADSIVQTAPLRNLSDLLNGRAPGMAVQASSGTAGAGSRIRIRGLSSLLTNEDPIVIVDGVRIDATYSSTGFGSGAPTTGVIGGNSASLAPPSGNQATPLYTNVPVTSRLNDIDIESIESIDILRGPAASTLYGSDAANGVIVIKTKRGRPGPSRWSVTGQRGRSSMKATFADSYYGWGAGFGNIPLPTSCTLIMMAARQCTQDSITHFNPLNVRETSPFGGGRSQRVSGQVSGGVPTLQYFLGGSYEDNIGILTLPSAIAATTAEQLEGTPVPSWAKRPNTHTQTTATNTLSSQPNTKTDLSLTLQAAHTTQTNAPDGESGIVGRAVSSLGYRDTITNGWGPVSPIDNFLTRYSNEVSRVNGSVSAQWRPWTPVSGSVSGGVDYVARSDEALLRGDLVIPTITTTSLRNRDSRTTMVKNGNATVSLNMPWKQMRFRTTLGGQYAGSSISSITANAQGLVSGGETVNGASSVFTYEFDSEWITAGWYLEQSVDVNDRVYLTAAVRQDASSAFGQGAQAATYPKFSVSWLVSQEPRFPRIPHLGTLRLRAAFGQAGSQPDVAARFLTYVAPPVAISGDPLFVVNTIGNPSLLPERSQEIEGGADLGLYDDRIVVEATMYHKQTRNALVIRPLPASAGVISQVQNIGRLSNNGFELSATVRPLTRSMFDWSSTLGYSRNTNKVAELGTASQQNGLYGRYAEGYPVDGVWARAISSVEDANENGVIEASEIRLTDSAVYAGTGLPASQWNLHNSVALLSGRVRVSASVSYRSDMTQVNGMLLQQCQQRRCRGAVDPTANVALQTLAVTATSGMVNTVWPYLEQTSTFRFDEFSLSVIAPASILRIAHAKTATISFLGRNLGLWTKYRGADPMVNAPGSTGSTARDQFADFGGTPQPRDWSVRINLTY